MKSLIYVCLGLTLIKILTMGKPRPQDQIPVALNFSISKAKISRLALESNGIKLRAMADVKGDRLIREEPPHVTMSFSKQGPPNSANATAPTDGLKDDEDIALRTTLQLPMSNGVIKARLRRADGSFGVREEFEDGSIVDRNYGHAGQLTGESIRFSDGERVDRMYDGDGQIKGIAWMRLDGVRTDALYTNGAITGKTDLLPDGTQIITRYDAEGNPIGRWQAGRNGTWKRIG